MILEACVGNLEKAIIAEKKGAHQIELCDRLDLDGTSPSIETIKLVSDHLRIPIKVIVNPNPFDYLYSAHDIRNIVAYIKQLNSLPIDGIVFGPLTNSGLPDLETIKIIADHTDLPITYHKAIDKSIDILTSTAQLLDQGLIKAILSSGGKDKAQAGIENLLMMKSLTMESEIEIIGAGGITSANLHDLDSKLKLNCYHGKKIVGDLTLQ